MKRPALYILIPLSIGIASSRIFKMPVACHIAMAILLVVLTLLSLKSRKLSHISIYFAIFFAGIALWQGSRILPDDHISYLTSDRPRHVYIEGVIVDEPVITKTVYGENKITFMLNVIMFRDRPGWRRLSGLTEVLIYSENKLSFDCGDRVVLEGLVTKPTTLRNPGLFDYSKYLEIKSVYSILRVKGRYFIKVIKKGGSGTIVRMAYRLRRWMRGSINKSFEPLYGGFINAILIGDRTSLDRVVTDDFVKTGTVHAIAISGLNISLIAGLFMSVLSVFRIHKKLILILTGSILILYNFIAGSNPPVTRAVITFIITATGYMIGRDSDMLNSISIAAITLLLANPSELFDPSFQLSFSSVISIIVFCDPIEKIIRADSIAKIPICGKVAAFIVKGISVLIAAWLGSWPIIASYFNIISPVSLLANIIVIPLLFILTAGSFIFLSMILISSIPAGVISSIICAIERALFAANSFLAKLPFAYFRIGAPPPISLFLYYSQLVFVIYLLSRPVMMNTQKRKIYIAWLLLLSILVWKAVINVDTRKTMITFLDVGHGDSTFIEFSGCGTLLIDGGSGGECSGLDAGKSVIAPFLWNKGVHSIDAVVITHFHEDHLGGVLYILKNFKVGCVIDNGAFAGNSRVYEEYIRIVKQCKIKRLIAKSGDRIRSFSGADIFVLNPDGKDAIEDSNENSLVLKICFNYFSVLMCGDVRDGGIERLISHGYFLRSDILKIPHHGGGLGKEGAVSTFFEKVSPRICVTSMARRDMNNRSCIDALQRNGSNIFDSFKTAEDGAIIISNSGRYIVAKTTVKN